MIKDSLSSIFRAARLFLSGTLLSRISGLLRDMALAFSFGTSASLAAFMLAYRFAHLLRRVFGEGCLHTAFVPHFEEVRAQDPQKAYHFFQDLSWLLFIVVGGVIAGISALLAVCTYSGWLSEGNREILFLTLLMMPSLLFICLYGLNASLLQCEGSYFIPGVAPVAFNLFSILGALYLYGVSSSQAMPWLSGITVLGCAFQWGMTLPPVFRLLRQRLGAQKWRGVSFYSQDIRKLAGPFSLGLMGVAATQVNSAMDGIFARWADPEGPAYLWYAIRVQQLPLALFGVALSGALLPPLSRAAKGGNTAQFRQFLHFAFFRSLAFMIPVTAAIFMLGEASICWLYGRGDFQAESILQTTRCLWGYGIGLVPATLILVFAPAFYARGDYQTPARGALYAMGCNALLNGLMVAVFHLGAASIAIATSISCSLNAWYLGRHLLTNLSWETDPVEKRETGKVLLATLGAIGATAFFQWILWEKTPFTLFWKGIEDPWPVSFLKQTLYLVGPTGCFMVTLFGIGWQLQAKNMRLLKG